jgi:AraC-like DNA-binding protein
MQLAETTSRRGILHPAAARRHFRLQRYAPAPALAHLVERHWVVEWDLAEPFTQEIVSHPSVNLVFEPALAAVHGVGTGRTRHRLEGAGRTVGTKFRPGGFHPFLPVPAWTLTDRVLSLPDALGPAAADLPGAVAAAGDETRQIAVVEAFLRARRPPADPWVAAVGEIFATILAEPAIVRVEDLARRCGLSTRALQRLFREYVGVPPKWVLRRVRLHEAAERLADGRADDWPRLALELGYFDQAHFIKDFKAVVGRSPADYAAG